jgi:aconitate hydratase
MDIDFASEPLGKGGGGEDVFLADIWPTQKEITDSIRDTVKTSQFTERYAEVLTGPEAWRAVQVPEGSTFAWEDASTYIRNPPFFDAVEKGAPPPPRNIEGARVLALLGDSVTTDHISPAGSIASDSPAAKYLVSHGVSQRDFNSYGSRRGNHEVMVRGTFANVRLRNQLAPGTEGGITRHLPDGEQMSIYDASVKYRANGVPLIIIAGKEYGAGSSRDWAAKGPLLLGVSAVITESYERIHRSNLIGMGILPLEFLPGETRASHGLTGEEVYAIEGISDLAPGRRLTVRANDVTFEVLARIDTPQEAEYYKHGGILQYVLRQLAG